MSEHALLAVLSVLVTIACALLTALLVSMARFKKGFEVQVDKICAQNKDEHKDIWERVNHHWHNGGGNVVIPTPGTIKGN